MSTKKEMPDKKKSYGPEKPKLRGGKKGFLMTPSGPKKRRELKGLICAGDKGKKGIQWLGRSGKDLPCHLRQEDTDNMAREGNCKTPVGGQGSLTDPVSP